jgi:serine/threonine-protein kinase
MFQDEARVGAMLHHPNVCETYEIAEVKGIHYLAMEWVDGTSLLRLLRTRAPEGEDGSILRTGIDPRIAARIVSDACAGLHAAHELVGEDGTPLRLVHRDATPHNILITADGRVKLSDFGVAKALGNAHATLAGQIKGKMSYMAPEQLCGDPLDRRADIFALGVCLYESVCGRKAFIGESDPEVMSQIILGQIDPPSAVAPHVPPALEEIIMKALQVQPDDRFSTALEMHLALEHFLSQTFPRISTADVAALLEERCGREIHDRRENIRIACIDPSLADGPASEPPTEIFVPISEGDASATRSVPKDVPSQGPWEEYAPHSAALFAPPPPSNPYGYPPPPPSYGGAPPPTMRTPGAGNAGGAGASSINVILVAAGVAALVGVIGVVVAMLLWRRNAASEDRSPPSHISAPSHSSQ